MPGWTPGNPYFVNAFVAAFPALRPAIDELIASGGPPPRPLDAVRLRAPIPRPVQLLAAPLNYRAHRAEMTGPLTSGKGTANELGFFLKASGAISGPADDILLPPIPDRRFDFEGEVAVVVGRRLQGASPDEALAGVFGYTILLDMTLRMTETEREERTMRKSYATFAPMGPWIVTADEVPDPARLSLRTWHNGVQCQQATLDELIVGVPDLLSRASHVLPLEPGDVYTTGSPAGVGQVVPGDRLEVEVPAIGRLAVDVAARPW
jgi:2-keto-4-pentenoate hydratase/2-oxohepta-3-ene-1,7-dioic acid hydratase in catechol pathway